MATKAYHSPVAAVVVACYLVKDYACGEILGFRKSPKLSVVRQSGERNVLRAREKPCLRVVRSNWPNE